MDTTADTFIKKLNTVIERRMHNHNEEKTVAIRALAEPLNVRSRQIWLWLAGSFPKKMAHVMETLDKLLVETDKISPAVPIRSTSFPFRIVISRKSIKVSRDNEGNIIVDGLLDLI